MEQKKNAIHKTDPKKLDSLMNDREAWLNADWDEAWEKLEKDLSNNDLIIK